MNLKLLLLLLSISLCSFSQQATQSVSGNVTDKSNKQPLIGATVILNNSSNTATLTDENGRFEFKNVPIGRISVRAQYIGYEAFTTEELILSSVRPLNISIELNAGAINADEVTVTATKNAFEPLNDLSVVSTRSFTAEETERIPAGVNDPGRVALSYPGVQRGQDDNENQIVVRGNSPVGVLWRLEGIDIPNPNHFAVIGSSGGGITVFSAQLLAKSDFSTGGFSAEYGNAISGAFDVHFRNGDMNRRVNKVRIGLLGLDYATEGPLKKGRSSYLINYRYSTLGLLSKLGFNLVGERVTNDFQDLSFNLVFNSKNTKSRFTVFGIGGLSEEHYLPVEDPAKRNLNIANHSEDRIRPANMGTLGTTWTYLPNSRSYFKVVVALMASKIVSNQDTLSLKNVPFRYQTEEYTDTRLATSLVYQHKIGEKSYVKTGLIANQIFFEFLKQSTPRNTISDVTQLQTKTNVKGTGNTQMLQQYALIHSDLTPKLSMNVGYHWLYLAANKTQSIEPRLSFLFQPKSNQRLSLAYGLHSRALPLMAYYFTDSLGNFINKNLKLLKAHHAVLAYHLYTKNRMRISAETYVQGLLNVPVEPNNKSNYWMLNNSSGFPEFKVISEGTGLNYGLDLAVEKSFSNNYYVLINGSALKSTYTLPSGATYNSRFSTRFSTAYTLGREFNFKKGRVLQIGGRYLFNGGFRYTSFDPVKSKEAGRFVALTNDEFGGQVPAYQRLDGRIAYRFNAKKIAGQVSLDIQNVTNRMNARSVGYSAATNELFLQYNSGGFTPILAFQVDF